MELVCVLLLIHGCFLGTLASYNFAFADEELRPCGEATKPCKMFIQSLHDNGTLRQLYNTGGLCACGPGITCPNSWEDSPERTVSRYLSQQGTSLSIQFKYCNLKSASRVCRGREIALTLKGTSIMPQEVTSLNCSCPENRPLYLRTVKRSFFYRYEEYVCSMPRCSASRRRRRPCSRYDSAAQKTIFLCRCPVGQRCKRSRGQEGPARGYCS